LLKVHQVYEVAKKHNVPIIGQGGIATAEDAATRGQSISSAFAASTLISPAVTEAMHSGEQTGQMSTLLISIADYLDEENEVVVRSLTSIIEPVSGQVIDVDGVTFTWSAVATATAYDLRVVDAQGGTIFTGSLTGNGSTTTVISLPNDGSYTFRVRACVNAISDGTCSLFASRNFSITKDAPTEAPTVTAPSAGAHLTASAFTFAWTGITPPVNGTLFYEVRLLIVPGYNDDPELLARTARWLSEVDPHLRVVVIGFRSHGVRPHEPALHEQSAAQLAERAAIVARSGALDVVVV